jgi:hypothetical protein
VDRCLKQAKVTEILKFLDNSSWVPKVIQSFCSYVIPIVLEI